MRQRPCVLSLALSFACGPLFFPFRMHRADERVNRAPEYSPCRTLQLDDFFNVLFPLSRQLPKLLTWIRFSPPVLVSGGGIATTGFVLVCTVEY
jgi:hypothetical protein